MGVQPGLQESRGTGQRHRLWVGFLVLASVGLVLAAKALRPGQRAVRETSTAVAIVAETAADSNEPFPTSARAQVEWVLRHHRPAMILFYSTYCRPCMMMDALVQMVKRDYQPQVVFIEVLYDDPANAELLRWAKVGSIPASVFISPSGETKRVVGIMNQAALREELAALAGHGSGPTRSADGRE